MKEDTEQIATRLNMETARISWQELERHFARWVLLAVSPTLDMVQVGVNFINDNKLDVDGWLKNGDLRKTTDEDASSWSKDDSSLWAVMSAPWVLVQEK